MKKTILAALAMTACLTMGSAAAYADVTGDFKVLTAVYTGDDTGGTVAVSGTVNHGAIQSKKSVEVSVSYDYYFEAEKTVITPGETTTTVIFVPGKCITGIPNRNGCDSANPRTSENWIGSYKTSSVTTAPVITTQTFEGSTGMTANTAPTVERGRLNPKGKITGYNWASNLSIVANDSVVDASLIPEGFTLVPGSVKVINITYTADLKDSYGPIADTIVTGDLL